MGAFNPGTSFENKGLGTTSMPTPPPKKKSPDPNSYAMTQLQHIMRGIKPSSASQKVASQKIIERELERQQKEEDERIYESKQRGTRYLEKFRDDMFLKPRSGTSLFKQLS